MDIRIDELPAAPSAIGDQVIAVMRSGHTFFLSVSQISALITALITDSAPSTLDTLNELAAALGDDPNFATTITSALALKASLNGSETLTNKTLTAPVLNRPVVNSPSGEFLRGFIRGLTLSNGVGGDAASGIVIASGSAGSDGTTPVLMTLASAMTKRLDAAWAAGTGNGGRDTGSLIDGTWHAFLIQRSDTGATDVIFSLSPTSPTLPANYDRKAYIAPVVRASGSLLGFTQVGRDTFVLTNPGLSTGTINTTAGLFALTGCPTGVNVLAEFSASIFSSTVNIPVFFSSPMTTDGDPGVGARASLVTIGSSAWVAGQFNIVTDTSGRFRARSNAISISSFGTAFTGFTLLR